MKLKLYATNHDAELLAQLELDRRSTAEETALVTEREWHEQYESREQLIRWYFSHSALKLAALGFLIDRLRADEVRSVISIGAGGAVLEHLLAAALPPGTRVVASDFDRYQLQKVEEFFPELETLQFDFVNEDSTTLAERAGAPLEAAVFFGSTYVMSDEEFTRCLEGLWNAGVRVVFDFQGGFIDRPAAAALAELRYRLKLRTRAVVIVKSLLRRPADSSALKRSRGKFHGYARSARTLRRIYRAAGCQVEEIGRVGFYPYVAVLRTTRGA